MMWLELRSNLLNCFYLLWYCPLLQKCCILLSVPQQVLFLFVAEMFLLLNNYHVLHKISYYLNLKWCDCSWGAICWIFSTYFHFVHFCKNAAYYFPCHNRSFSNLLQICLFCWINTMYYIKWVTTQIWKDVIRVGEQFVELILLTLIMSSSLKQLHILFSVPKQVLC